MFLGRSVVNFVIILTPTIGVLYLIRVPVSHTLHCRSFVHLDAPLISKPDCSVSSTSDQVLIRISLCLRFPQLEAIVLDDKGFIWGDVSPNNMITDEDAL
jgi:hypothetical protein